MTSKKETKQTSGKPKITTLLLEQFPEALACMALQTQFGNHKHENYCDFISHSSADYRDAAGRHLSLATEWDMDSEMVHLVAAAWSATAALELYIKEGNAFTLQADVASLVKAWEDKYGPEVEAP